MKALVGTAVDRVDGRDKVTGKATYSAEWRLERMAHAVLVTAPSAPARIRSLDTHAAEQAPGVLAVLTHKNALPGGLAILSAPIGRLLTRPIVPPDSGLALSDEVVRYAGQPIAVVVAASLEQAQAAARLVAARYERGVPATELAAQLGQAFSPGKILGEAADKARGDLAAGLKGADLAIDVVYTKQAENHQPMEPHATIADFGEGKLTLYDATQFVHGVKLLVAMQLGKLPHKVRVVSRYVGGAFGSKGLPWPHVALAAIASERVGRPVKLVVERRQMSGMVGFRPGTHQRVRLGAMRDGRLMGIGHDSVNQTSQFGEYSEPNARPTQMLYACPNVAVTHRLVRLDTQTPTFQRAPGEAVGSLALECAMDELAHALKLDPLALRLVNFAERDEDKDKPWSSKALKACYEQGAERFGWARRKLAPRSMTREGLLVGWGMATASFPCNRSGASARVRLAADGRATVQIASHDLGTGTYTILSQVAADALGLPMDRVRTELGDSDYPQAPVSGGSQSAASCSPAVHKAALAVRQALVTLALADQASPLHGLAEDQVAWGEGRLHQREQPARGEAYTAILQRAGQEAIEVEEMTKPGEERSQYSSHAWGAQFAEVTVDPDLGMVRVTRMVGAFAGGRILNPKTARSQLMGGMVMGIGSALLEEVVRDPHQGRVVTSNLEGYMVPTHADVPKLEVILVPEVDEHVNPLGIKGLGELGIVGAGAAIANAVFHATGRRVRDFPISVEKLL